MLKEAASINLFFIWQQFKTGCKGQVTVWQTKTVSNECMKMQELFDNLTKGFLMSENPLIALDLLSGGYLAEYGHQFQKLNNA